MEGNSGKGIPNQSAEGEQKDRKRLLSGKTDLCLQKQGGKAYRIYSGIPRNKL